CARSSTSAFCRARLRPAYCTWQRYRSPTGHRRLFTLDQKDGALKRDRLLNLLPAIERAGVGATGAPLPVVALAVTDAEAWLAPLRIANLLKSGIVVGRDKAVAATVAMTICAIAFGAAFFGSGPGTMVAVPRCAMAIDLHAEARRTPMCMRAMGRASRANCGAL